MLKSPFSISLLVLVLMSPLTQAATNCAAVTEIPSTECEALIALYNSTDGDNWTDNAGWNVTDTPCSWYGVSCSGGHVSWLKLYSNNLTGSIPSELGNLSNLTELILLSNNLTGTIPSELGNLSNLEWLFLSSNNLTGTIPTELGNLSNLEWLALDSNNLTGEIPTELGNLSNLEWLILSSNNLTGEIPTELSNLSWLWLSSNKLTGEIPTELGNLSNLESLYLDSNKLTGEIPTELGNLINLKHLYLYSNNLTGEIPSELGNLSNLERLYLDSNKLTGEIPKELGNLSNLSWLRLDNNELCGEIPVELKNLSNIPLPNQYRTYLQLDNNHLTASDSELIAWLDNHNPGWNTTQTPCPTLQFSSTTYNINEDSGQATITVTRTGGSSGAVSADYATTDDTATAGSDYNATSGTLNWANSDTTDKTFTINIIDDSEPENEETLIVSLGNPTGAQLGTPDTAMLTITDNDQDAFSCKQVTEISKKECKALIALYETTDGENWTENNNWKVTNTPCNWYGVTCKKGSVEKLELPSNNLKGFIPIRLFKLKKLEILVLSDNKLYGRPPYSLMWLKKLDELDLNDNCLKTKVFKKLKKWLDELNPGWDETQTACLY